MVYVTDDLINSNVANAISTNFRNFLWQYGNVASPESAVFFGRVLYHNDGNINIEYDPNIDVVVESGRRFLKERLHGVKDIVLHRILANGQLPGMIAGSHIDWPSEDMATMIYYVSDSNGGGTQLYDQTGNKSSFVDFKQGRCAFFPSMMLHEGVAPSSGWRISLGIMFKLILEDNQK